MRWLNPVGGAEALSAWQSAHGYDDASFKVALKRSAEAAWMRDKIIADVPTYCGTNSRAPDFDL